MPPWLVFNAQRSSMYPEIYVALEFRRGSQNRNHFNKLREEEGYIPNSERVRRRKKLKKMRMNNPGANHKLNHAAGEKKKAPQKMRTKKVSLVMPEKPNQSHFPRLPTKSSELKEKRVAPDPPSCLSSKPGLPPSASPASSAPTPTTLPVALPEVPATSPPRALPTAPSDVVPSAPSAAQSAAPAATLPDTQQAALPPNSPHLPSTNNYYEATATTFGHNGMHNRSATDSIPDTMPLNGVTCNTKDVGDSNKNSRKARSKRVMVSKKKNCVVIDTQVLAMECESGRYPTVTRFDGKHEELCTLCKKPGESAPIDCVFCKNTVHQVSKFVSHSEYLPSPWSTFSPLLK